MMTDEHALSRAYLADAFRGVGILTGQVVLVHSALRTLALLMAGPSRS